MVHIFELLSKKSISKVLIYFLEHPTKEIYAQQLENELKIARKSMFDGLSELLKAGVLEAKEVGRTKQYKLRKSSPLVRQLKILHTLDEIIPMLKKIKGTGIETYLYGSAARGEDTEKSDIDLLLIGDRPRSEVLGKIMKKENVKPVYMTYLEYANLARKDKAFYERIEKDKIRLI